MVMKLLLQKVKIEKGELTAPLQFLVCKTRKHAMKRITTNLKESKTINKVFAPMLSLIGVCGTVFNVVFIFREGGKG